MKYKISNLGILFFVIVATIMCGCQREEINVSFEYAPYISAYTGGIISTNSTIRIEMSQERNDIEVGKEIEQPLFKFKPNLKGKAYWLNNKIIEFVPDSGALKPGTLYQVRFKLNKIEKDVPSKLRHFDFSFRVQERSFYAELTSMNISESEPDLVSVIGSISFSEPATISQVEKMFVTKFNGKKQDIRPQIASTSDPLIYTFSYQHLAKKDQQIQFNIEINGHSANIDQEQELSINIPAKGDFKLYSAQSIQDPENGIRLTFTEPLDASQNIQDFISIKGIASFVAQQEGNIVDLFFNNTNNLQEITLTLHEGLQSSTGRTLPSNVTEYVTIQPEVPAVKLLSSGNILPNAKELLLPFQTVALRSVNVKIIKIYEDNVLMFLQNNSLNGCEHLKRAGRLIYKKKLLLNEKTAQHWTNYSIDLSKLIKQEPGAIYRVELSFNQSDAIAPFNGAKEGGKDEGVGMVSIRNGEISENEQKEWDYINDYSWYDNDDIDWNTYRWQERNNPYHPTYYMIAEHKAITNILASNIGLIIKSNGDNNYWITATDILTSKPKGGVIVSLYNYQLQCVGKAVTDNQGFAYIETPSSAFAAVASLGKEKSYLRLVEGENNSVSRFDVGGEMPDKGMKGFIYGERGVWRPGDTLHLTFMLEDANGKIPDNHPVSLELYNPSGQYVYNAVAKQGVHGFYVFHVPTDANAPTGFWNAYVKVGSASFHKSLRIETIKPNRLKVDLKLPTEKLQSTQTPAQATLSAVWLTGATARNLRANVEMSLTKVNTQFKGFEDYTFINPATSFRTSTTTILDGHLDEHGNVNFRYQLPASQSLPGLLNAQFICRVFETGGDASLYTKTVPLSPYPRYVGINLKQDEYQQYFDIAVLNADGKLVNIKNDLEYKIYKTDWSWWWENDYEDFSAYINNTSIEPVAIGSIKLVNGRAKLSTKDLQIEDGQYLIYVKDPVGGHATGGTTWIGHNNNDKENPTGIKMLAFSTDKTNYEVGEKATIFIPNGQTGRALLSIENGSKVITRKWFDFSKDKSFTIDITEDMAPNAYFHISLLQPHSQTINDLPIRMYGVKPIFVTNKKSILKPVITAPKSVRPESQFSIKVKEQNGQPMTYTLAIVDDGLLDLTNFKTPNPWDYFYAREALGIRTWDLFDYVIGAFAGKYGSLFSIGGDQQLNAAKNRSNRFSPVVKFIGPFTIKKGEEKNHTIQLPPYIGSVRVMVVAGQDGCYGNSEKEIEVKAPLMLLSTLPRVVSTNEQIELPVNIFAMEKSVKNVTVNVKTTGKLKLEGQNSQSVTFTTTGDKMAYFKLRSGKTTGQETITITASGNGQTAKEVIHLEIRNPNPSMMQNDAHVVKAGESVSLPYGNEGSDYLQWIKMEVSSIPAIDISSRLEYLYNYTHRCTEQITSCALPLLFADQLKDLTKEEQALNQKNIKEAIKSLYSRQLTNGGFAYWDGERTAQPWVTSYAGVFLVLAKEKGYEVHTNVINKWKEYQKKQAQSWQASKKAVSTRYAFTQYDLEQAYRLYSLALANTPEYGAMNRLKENKSLSLQARWCLASAYALCGKSQVAQSLISKQSTAIAPYSCNNSTFGSNLRDEAMILETLILLNNDKAAYAQAVRVSNQMLNAGLYETQSTAFALCALAKLAKQSSQGLYFSWSQQGGNLHEVKTAKNLFQQTLSKPIKNEKMTLKNLSNGNLYVCLSSKSQPMEDKAPAQSQNIRLNVSYHCSNGTFAIPTKIQKGTDISVVIQVTNTSNTDYTNVALTHIIPSGLEIYNERLFRDESANSSQPFIYQDLRDDRILTYFDLPRNSSKTIKVRLQATYGGEFVLPAILCQAMYDPTAYARTQAGRITIEN